MRVSQQELHCHRKVQSSQEHKMPNKSGKTPYEIRLELLQLAQSILQAQHNARGVQNGNNVTTAPTTEEVMAEAEKLNSFVSKANN
jgi:hypothetical protein